MQNKSLCTVIKWHPLRPLTASRSFKKVKMSWVDLTLRTWKSLASLHRSQNLGSSRCSTVSLLNMVTTLHMICWKKYRDFWKMKYNLNIFNRMQHHCKPESMTNYWFKFTSSKYYWKVINLCFATLHNLLCRLLKTRETSGKDVLLVVQMKLQCVYPKVLSLNPIKSFIRNTECMKYIKLAFFHAFSGILIFEAWISNQDLLLQLPQFCSHHHCWVQLVPAELDKLWSPYQL